LGGVKPGMNDTRGRPENTRAHPRYDIRIGADVQAGDKVITAMTKNLSLGGVGLVLDRAIPEGITILVTLFVVLEDVEDSATEPFEIGARVAWCRRMGPETYEAGLAFEAMTAERQVFLGRYLALQPG